MKTRERRKALSQALRAEDAAYFAARKAEEAMDIERVVVLPACLACKGRAEVWRRAYGEGEWLETCARCNGTGIEPEENRCAPVSR